MYTIIVTGSRDFYDWELVFHALNTHTASHPNFLLKMGDCPTGADLFAYMYAEAIGCSFTRFFADWEKFKKAAGPIRNHEMVDSGADLVLGFPRDSSRGTKDCCTYAASKGIPVMFPEMDEPYAPRSAWWEWAERLRTLE